VNVEDVKRVGIVGAGTIGSTIAAGVALKYDTVVNGVTLEGAQERISRCFPALVRKGKITEEEKQACLSRFTRRTEKKAYSLSSISSASTISTIAPIASIVERSSR